MNCPRCQSAKAVKNGTLNGKQRYKCKTCGCNYTQSKSRKIPLPTKIEALKLYLEGVGFRAIERLTGVCHTTVMRWVKRLADEIEKMRPEVSEQVMTVELDEMWHFVQKKAKNAGYGLPGIEKRSVA